MYNDVMARKGQKTQVGQDKSEIVTSLPRACSDETAAVEFIEQQRWGDTPYCPHCGSVDVYKMTDAATGQRNKRFLWRCHDCKEQFTVRIGSVLEDSRIPLRHWCFAFWAAASSKKGVSALQIKRQTGLSYKSALFLMHRIRFAMAPLDGPKLTGIVEADETWVGGKPRHHFSQRPADPNDPQRNNYKSRYRRQKPVFAAVQRNGQARVRVIPSVTAENLRKAVLDHIDLSARLMTDEHSGYRGVGKMFEGGHDQIQHKNQIYARGDVTTNTVEGFFAILKRGITGVYHNVSHKHLQRYLDEFEFRYNHRDIDDGDRTAKAIKMAEGKRLTYREPVRKAS
jgi:transposase-like protein